MQAKRFLVQFKSRDLPHWFLNNINPKAIDVVSCHLSSNGMLERGYVLESNISHSEPYIDGFVCYINEHFEPKRYEFQDLQMRSIEAKIKNEDDQYIDIDEIVDINTGVTVDIPIEDFDPLLHRFRYKLRLELV
jgi:hypothetical protein